jgi:hypothetical protein
MPFIGFGVSAVFFSILPAQRLGWMPSTSQYLG